MTKEIFEKRKIEFIEYIIKNERLPKVWENHFSDREDMRLWFNDIYKLDKFKEFNDEMDIFFKKYNIKVLDDKIKEIEFLNYILKHNCIPQYGESYFSDNDEMKTWYNNYRRINPKYETRIHNSLREYLNLDLAEIWTKELKDEFKEVIKLLKRIPKHGEAILQNGIDVRSIYDKLEDYDPLFIEKLNLYLHKINEKGLSDEEKEIEFLSKVRILKYIPFLQESRFSDGTDMFTWYNRHKYLDSNLEKKANEAILGILKRKVNIYLIPNFKNTGGNFYTICTNEGERLDLSEVKSFEEAKKLDSTLVKKGGVILKKDEEIESVNFVKGKSR